MKKNLIFVLILLSFLIVGCNQEQKTYYSVDFEYDQSQCLVLISGIKNDEGKYYGNIDVSIDVQSGYQFDYCIDVYTNTLYYETEFTIENISANYNLKIFVSKKVDEAILLYYSTISEGLNGNGLKSALRDLITTTHTYITDYDDCKDLAYISETDKDPNKPGHIILFWSNISIPCKWDGGTTWNREHVWPQSLGWFKTSGAGSDLHHIRPVDPSVNSSHGNLIYGVASGNRFSTTSSINGSVQTLCKVGGGYFEPADFRKGDTARIIFYLLTRYSEADMFSPTSVSYSMDLLLEWNELDPVDELEIYRNNAVYEIQGNRNPFIDNSEYAELIWG